MRIQQVDARRIDLPLTRPYEIASAVFDAASMVWVEIVAEGEAGRVVGLGSGTPSSVVTGETIDACAAALALEQTQWLLGRDVLGLPALCRELRVRMPATPAARAALDIALHDLWAKCLGRPLVDVLGRAHERLPTSITIGILDVAETLAESEEYFGRGFRCLKVKVGAAVELDLERLRKLRERWGASVVLRVDANCGYAPADLDAFLCAACDLDLELVEQPLPRGGDEPLRGRAAGERRLLAADESLHSVGDALALAAPPSPPYGVFNIKLMKCGGVHEAMRIASIGEAAGIDLMWGCMDESVVGIAAALHAAFASPATRYLDLDGSLDLARDPAIGGFVLEGGALRTTDAVGLGVESA